MKTRVFALIDCNNFFVSCERIFRPDLEGRPVVVLSSNDGCAVARSNEAKRLGIPMGAPAFKYRQLFERERVVRFSANFELYSDISRRITHILTEVTPRIEIYSIDESFLDLSTLDIRDYEAWGRAVRTRIQKEVGVPVSVGIAPTKTLAKLATEYAKQHPDSGGATSFIDKDLKPYRQHIALEDIWGIGWRLAPRLRALGLATADDVAGLRPQLAQKLMGIHGRQLVYELNGTACFPMELLHQKPKSIARTRTFGEDTREFYVLEAAVANFVTQAAFRLRQSAQLARRLGLFLCSNKHKPNYQIWNQEAVFQVPTADTGQLISAGIALLTDMYEPTTEYHRAGVWLHDFVPADQLQTDLLGTVDVREHARAMSRMQAIDGINNRYGRRTIRFAAEDLAQAWQPKHGLRSPRYVSTWEELPLARIV